MLLNGGSARGLERCGLCGPESDKMLTSRECAPASPLPQDLAFGPPCRRVPPASLKRRGGHPRRLLSPFSPQLSRREGDGPGPALFPEAPPSSGSGGRSRGASSQRPMSPAPGAAAGPSPPRSETPLETDAEHLRPRTGWVLSSVAKLEKQVNNRNNPLRRSLACTRVAFRIGSRRGGEGRAAAEGAGWAPSRNPWEKAPGGEESSSGGRA